MEGPRLTFFVELDFSELEALFARPEVLPFLAENGCALSMGLVDLTAERAARVRELESRGVPVTAWLLLDVADGYWLNADNAERAVERWRETRAWAEREGLRLERVGLDIEFPRSEAQGLVRDRRRATATNSMSSRSRAASIGAGSRSSPPFAGAIRRPFCRLANDGARAAAARSRGWCSAPSRCSISSCRRGNATDPPEPRPRSRASRAQRLPRRGQRWDEDAG